ncbi:hypothetical protein NQ314_015207 [Rhamnusium bicolor]|uniref:DDE Tnp4 domain-containing protein n=1 Tax=Rhamnusium bicolor TaxID=1586634 RepID=A0AAV8X1K2_9CUCU|nr:hypothetical protein NQ314_015207 [Rhamnusium bicolor]
MDLSNARSPIERAFALLKKRFRCLIFLDVLCMEWIPKYIIACCVLHNICIQNNDILDMEEIINNENIADEVENFERKFRNWDELKEISYVQTCSTILIKIIIDNLCAQLYNNK